MIPSLYCFVILPSRARYLWPASGISLRQQQATTMLTDIRRKLIPTVKLLCPSGLEWRKTRGWNDKITTRGILQNGLLSIAGPWMAAYRGLKGHTVLTKGTLECMCARCWIFIVSVMGFKISKETAWTGRWEFPGRVSGVGMLTYLGCLDSSNSFWWVGVSDWMKRRNQAEC